MDDIKDQYLLNNKIPPKATVECDEDFPCWMIWKRRRYVLAVLAFFGFFNIYAMRVNLSIGIVAMTANKSILLDNGTTIYQNEFDWDSVLQGHILSSFFYGYILTQLLGGWIGSKVGGKRVFGIGIAVTAFCTVITPILARHGVYLLLAARFLEGVFEGFAYPCIHALWAKWVPPLERTRIVSFAFSGCYVGTVVAMPVCAYLADYFGWESIFYVFGTAGLVWVVFWWFLVADTPREDPYIRRAELKYITDSLGNTDNNRSIKHPWRGMLTSMPMWAIVMAHFSESWGFYTMLTELPKFMNDVLHFDLNKAGLMSAMPYLAMSIIILLAGHLGDYFLSRKILTTTQVRKIFNCSAFLAQSIFMLSVALFSSSAVGSTICLILGVGFCGLAWAGFMVNYLDIAPQHASIMMGIGNTFATLPGIISPTITGYIVTTGAANEWKVIFYITSAVYFIGCVVYGIFASGELQPWAMESQPLKENITAERKDCDLELAKFV